MAMVWTVSGLWDADENAGVRSWENFRGQLISEGDG